MGKFDYFVEGLQSYNPEKNKSKYEKFLEKMTGQKFVSGGGSYGRVGDNLFVYNPDNTARDQAIALQNQQNMIASAQKKENKRKRSREYSEEDIQYAQKLTRLLSVRFDMCSPVTVLIGESNISSLPVIVLIFLLPENAIPRSFIPVK